MTITTGSWLRPPGGTSGAPLMLLCFAHAGGGAAFFRSWIGLLGPDVEVRAVVLPGRESRISEPPFTRMTDLIEPLAQGLLPSLDRPYALFGHSMGAAVAYELARRLSTDPERAPRRLLVSGRRAPHLAARHRPIAGIPGPDFLSAVAGLGGTPEAVLRQPDLLRLFAPVMRADFSLNETYRPAEGPRLACPVSAFTGDRDPEVEPVEMGLWRQVTDGGFRLRVYPGDHFYLGGLPEPLRGDLAADLAADVAALGRPVR